MQFEGKSWFCARDVAVALEYGNPAQAYKLHCKSLKLFSYLQCRELGWDNPNPQGVYFILEPDVYRLIVKSSKPEADKFEAWVFEEVLPKIRETGSYQTKEQPKFDIPQTYADALMLAAQQAKRIEEQDRQIEKQAPAVAFHKQVTENTDELMRMEEFCGLLKRKTGQDFNQTTLLRTLREFGIAKLENKHSGIGPRMFVPRTEYVPKWFVATMSDGGRTVWMARPVAVDGLFQLIERQRKTPELLPPPVRRHLVRFNRSGRFFN